MLLALCVFQNGHAQPTAGRLTDLELVRVGQRNRPFPVPIELRSLPKQVQQKGQSSGVGSHTDEQALCRQPPSHAPTLPCSPRTGSLTCTAPSPGPCRARTAHSPGTLWLAAGRYCCCCDSPVCPPIALASHPQSCSSSPTSAAVHGPTASTSGPAAPRLATPSLTVFQWPGKCIAWPTNVVAFGF